MGSANIFYAVDESFLTTKTSEKRRTPQQGDNLLNFIVFMVSFNGGSIAVVARF